MDETSSKFQKKFSIAPEQGHLARKKKLFFWTFYCDKQYFFRTLLSKIIALPCKLLANSFSVVLIGVCIVNTILLHSAKCVVQNVQDRVATAAETWVQWRPDFQSGSRVLKKDVLDLFLSISMAYNVIVCQKVAENNQIMKIAKFTM